ncbi:unnamed protein product, partial [Ectocarpus sp. 12 AP-2014]
MPGTPPAIGAAVTITITVADEPPAAEPSALDPSVGVPETVLETVPESTVPEVSAACVEPARELMALGESESVRSPSIVPTLTGIKAIGGGSVAAAAAGATSRATGAPPPPLSPSAIATSGRRGPGEAEARLNPVDNRRSSSTTGVSVAESGGGTVGAALSFRRRHPFILPLSSATVGATAAPADDVPLRSIPTAGMVAGASGCSPIEEPPAAGPKVAKAAPLASMLLPPSPPPPRDRLLLLAPPKAIPSRDRVRPRSARAPPSRPTPLPVGTSPVEYETTALWTSPPVLTEAAVRLGGVGGTSASLDRRRGRRRRSSPRSAAGGSGSTAGSRPPPPPPPVAVALVGSS